MWIHSEITASNVTSISPINIPETLQTIKQSFSLLNVLQNVKKPKTDIQSPSRCNLTTHCNIIPFRTSPEFQWKPEWELCPVVSSAINKSSIPTTMSSVSKSFEKLFLDKHKPLKPRQSKKRKTSVNRAKITTNTTHCNNYDDFEHFNIFGGLYI